MECNVSELVKRGHDKAAQLKSSGGAVSQLISDLATHLDVQLARSNALAAENAGARNAVQVFCDVVGANTDAICEEVGQDGVRAILAAMSATGNMPATDAFLAEVRAQGVDALAKTLEGLVAVSVTRSYITEFAAQLRKGVQS
ncbi:hypothetical protein UXP68_07835 [Enterobacter hormaechei]